MVNLLDFLQMLVHLYEIVLVITVIMSWLFASGRISRYDPRIRDVMQALDGLTLPLLRRIRPWLPNTGSIDLSPIVLWLVCMFVDKVVLEDLKQWLV